MCGKKQGKTINKCVEPCNTLFGPYVIWRCSVAALRLSLSLSLSPPLSPPLSLPKAHSNTDVTLVWGTSISSRNYVYFLINSTWLLGII